MSIVSTDLFIQDTEKTGQNGKVQADMAAITEAVRMKRAENGGYSAWLPGQLHL